MAQADFSMPPVGGAAGRKPKTSIYTLLLLIALVALLTGCLFLWLEIKRFGGFGTIRGTVQIETAPADTQFVQQPSVISFVG
jgi:hypothetical protein